MNTKTTPRGAPVLFAGTLDELNSIKEDEAYRVVSTDIVVTASWQASLEEADKALRGECSRRLYDGVVNLRYIATSWVGGADPPGGAHPAGSSRYEVVSDPRMMAMGVPVRRILDRAHRPVPES